MEIVGGRAGAPYAYFEPPISRHSGKQTLESTADALHSTLSQVVQEHLVADVPVGLLLSGGLDPSVIAALASRDTRVTTICMGFADSAVDERGHARTVAAHIGSNHHEELISQRDVVEGLEEVSWFFDDPFADWGTVSTRILYRRCRERGIKVVLVGEGSDELFGGATRSSVPQRMAAARSRGGCSSCTVATPGVDTAASSRPS